jgi:hypothetical protein
MKLFFAATVAALASQASAFKVVVDNDGGGYCLMVVKNDGSTDWAVDGSGNIDNPQTSALESETNGDGSPTIAQNGVNDPDGLIKGAADAAWANVVGVGNEWSLGPGADVFTNNLSVTFYEAGGAAALSSLAGLDPPSGSLSWCQAYSTMAPEHYCKADGAVASYQESTLSTTIQDCCNNNHGGNAGMENTCLEVSTGVKARGNAEWYISPSNDKCIRNCDTDNLFNPSSDRLRYANTGTDYTDTEYEYECGGLLTYQTSYGSLTTCCSTHFQNLIPDYCEYLAEVGSETGVAAYAGTGTKWYSDASNSICKKDCTVGSNTPVASPDPSCGGVITNSYIQLYDTAAACCSAELSWVSGCETKSTAGEGEPTELYWPDPSGCREDCDTASNCASAPSTARLYATAEECCKQANSWVDLDYCKTRADPAFTGTSAGSAGTNKWYVSYENGVCRNDCVTGDASCELADNGSLTFFDTAESCCKALLGSNDEDACVAGSDQGLSISTVPTSKWYVSTSGDQPCAQDCATGTGACGGIVSKTGVRLYETAAECCDQAYGWLNEDLCEKLSLNAGDDTDLWYVDYGANACKKDCTYDSSDPLTVMCGGRPDDITTPMYATADICCASKLNWIDKDTCKTASETGVYPSDSDSPGTGEWRKNSSWSACVLDCTAGADIETGDPIVGTDPLGTGTPLAVGTGNYPDQCDGVISDSSAVFYDASVENCCKSINWVQEETCVSISTDVVSEMFFADPSDRTKCLAHQEAAVTGGTTIACTAGVVSGGTAGTAATGVTCEETITTSTKLYSSLEDCCEANVNWDSDACVHRSRGTQATGTDEYYVDWSLSQCVQDCTTETPGSSCGGLAKAWDVLYKDSSSCCGRLSWLSRSKCVYVQT